MINMAGYIHVLTFPKWKLKEHVINIQDFHLVQEGPLVRKTQEVRVDQLVRLVRVVPLAPCCLEHWVFQVYQALHCPQSVQVVLQVLGHLVAQTVQCLPERGESLNNTVGNLDD